MERLWRWRVRTEGLGLVGLTQVDLGLLRRGVFGVWSFLGVSERVVVDKGLSWSERDGFFLWGSVTFAGDVGELQ